MPLYLFYTIVQKSQKWPKTQIKGGSCLKWSSFVHWTTTFCNQGLRVRMQKSVFYTTMSYCGVFRQKERS